MFAECSVNAWVNVMLSLCLHWALKLAACFSGKLEMFSYTTRAAAGVLFNGVIMSVTITISRQCGMIIDSGRCANMSAMHPLEFQISFTAWISIKTTQNDWKFTIKSTMVTVYPILQVQYLGMPASAALPQSKWLDDRQQNRSDDRTLNAA